MMILQTSRLLIREFDVRDAGFIFQLCNEPDWLRYIGNRKIYSLTDAEVYIENYLRKSYRDLGFGFWMVMTKDDRRPVGMCGLTQRVFLDHPDLGFAVLQASTGKGFAAEAARGVIGYARDHLRIPVLLAYTVPDNSRSVRLLHALGFRPDGLITIDDEPLSLFRLDATMPLT